MLFNSLQSVLSILLIIMIGWVFSKLKLFNADTGKLFTKIVLWISFPALMIYNLTVRFTRDDLFGMGKSIIVPFLAIIISYLIGVLAARIFKVAEGRRGIFAAQIAFSNAIFIGLPVNIMLFGEEAATYVMLYYLANTILFWTVGVWGIKRDATKEKTPLFSLQTAKKLVSPPLICFAVGLLLVIFNIKLPMFISQSFKYVGGLTTPLSLMFIGITIAGIHIKELSIKGEKWIILIGKFIIVPVLVIIFMKFIPIGDLHRKVFFIEAAMPVITLSAIVSREYGGDHQFAASIVASTTILSIIIIPLYMLLVNYL